MRNKKAQLFTVVALLMIALAFASFEIFPYLNQKESVSVRVSTMDNFLISAEGNFERQMFIAGFRTLFLAGKDIASTRNYIDVEDFFNEAFFNGSVRGIHQEILEGAYYSDLLDSLNNHASKINVNIVMTNPVINVSQIDPWFVDFTLTADLVMEDQQGLARWERKQIITALIPIEGLEDPVYTVGTYAKVSSKINQTPYEGNYVNSGDVSNLNKHLIGGYYSANPNAPSYLNRLEGNFGADENGIESFVYLPDLSAQGLNVFDKTVVDYIYFSADNPPDSGVSGMPSWFKIDDSDGHIEKYNVAGITF